MDLNQLENDLKIQKSHLSILQECLKNINNSIQNIDFFENPNSITELLAKVKANLDNLREKINYIEDLKNNYSNLEDFNPSDEEINNYYEKLSTASTDFNDFLIEYIKSTSFIIDNKTSNINETLEDSIKEDIPQLTQVLPQNTLNIEPTKTEPVPFDPPAEPKITKKFVRKLKPVEDIKEEEKSEEPDKMEPIEDSKDNKVLRISEKENKIFLPYTMKELNEILSTSTRYKDIQELIDKKYTFPLDKYKNGVISRFKETYNFMKRKERASIADSLDLALELAFNQKLNPAIILACKNLEQLDTYLDCLELDALDKFDYFEIRYEYSPIKKYTKKK